MADYFVEFFWGMAILLCFIGWGEGLRFFLVGSLQISLGVLAVWGVAFTIAFGGLVNLLGWISKPFIICYVLLGCTISFLRIFKHSLTTLLGHLSKFSKLEAALLLLICGLTLLRFAGDISYPSFNSWDDYRAYFVFPKKMIELGSLEADPFSERRLISSLGGSYFLNTLVLSVLSEKNLHLIDPGISIIIIVLLLISFGNQEALSYTRSLSVVVLFICLPILSCNITSYYMAIALLMGLLCTLQRFIGKEHKWGGFIIALVLSANICLKHNYLLTPLLFTFLCYSNCFAREKQNYKQIFIQLICLSAFAILLLMPWMIASNYSSGSLFFRVFGRGYHASSYGYDFVNLSPLDYLDLFRLLIVSPYFIVCLFLFFIILGRKSTSFPHETPVALLMASVITNSLATTVALGWRSGVHYSFPHILSALFMGLVMLLKSDSKSEKGARFFIEMYLFLSFAAFIIGSNFYQIPQSYKHSLDRIIFGLRNEELERPSEKKAYADLQSAVPSSEAILSSLERNYLLDFRRNKIYIADQLGCASPPPGWPIFENGEALAGYLLSKSIRYVAFSKSYQHIPLMSSSSFTRRRRTWIDSQFIIGRAAENSLLDLMESRKVIFRAHNMFLIDLTQSVQ